MSNTPVVLYNALIRTHHITSRKKVAVLRASAHRNSCYVLIRSGGRPGIMYCQGSETSVRQWVSDVQVKSRLERFDGRVLTCSKNLRYKDFRLASRPSPIPNEYSLTSAISPGSFIEVESVKEFGRLMEKLALLSWWRQAMGYKQSSS